MHAKHNLLKAYRGLMSRRAYRRLRGHLKSIGAWANPTPQAEGMR